MTSTAIESDSSASSTWGIERRKRRCKKSINKPTSPVNKKSKNGTGDIEQSDSPFLIPAIPPKNKESTSPKPPPIMVTNIKSFPELCKDLIQLVGEGNFFCRARSADLLIHTMDSDTYRKVVAYLRVNNAEYHCYQLNEEKSYRVVIRGLHQTTPPEVIKEELIAKNFLVKKVHQVTHPKFHHPLPLFFIDLAQNKDSAEIFKLQYLLYTKIRVEEPRKREYVVQCARCQQLGHTRGYCNHKPKCIKCAEEHLSKDCPHPLSMPAKCALCGGSHPANYRGCDTHRQLQQLRKQRQMPAAPQTPVTSTSTAVPPPARIVPPRREQPVRRQPPPPPAVASQRRSYAQAAAAAPHQAPLPAVNFCEQSFNQPQYLPAHPPASQPQSIDILSHLTTFLNDFKSLINPLITLLTTLVTNLLPKLSR